MLKKIILRSAIALSITFFLCISLLYISGNGFIVTGVQRTYLVGKNTANINDHNEFETNVIEASSEQAIPKHPNYNQKHLPTAFEKELNETQTAAFIVIQDGQVLYEKYHSGYDERSKTNSFSMAKTVTTLLLGIAIEEGFVRDLDQVVTDFIPEFEGDSLAEKATIGEFSAMTSGYDWDEQYYSPFSPTVELYYGDDVSDFLVNRGFSDEPGSNWYYSSASTQLMGIFLRRAIQKARGNFSLSDYLSEKLWKPMGMNDDALWHTDNTGMELTYCCINTNARNFAKLGLLMLNNGNWQGQQLVPASHIKQMIKPRGDKTYGLSTWLGLHKSPAFYSFVGHLGQFVIIVPEHNMVIVRLGEKPYPTTDFISVTVPHYIDAVQNLIN